MERNIDLYFFLASAATSHQSEKLFFADKRRCDGWTTDGIPNWGPGGPGGGGRGDIRCLGLSAAATQPSTPVWVVQAGCSAGRQRFCAGDKNSAVCFLASRAARRLLMPATATAKRRASVTTRTDDTLRCILQRTACFQMDQSQTRQREMRIPSPALWMDGSLTGTHSLRCRPTRIPSPRRACSATQQWGRGLGRTLTEAWERPWNGPGTADTGALVGYRFRWAAGTSTQTMGTCVRWHRVVC